MKAKVQSQADPGVSPAWGVETAQAVHSERPNKHKVHTTPKAKVFLCKYRETHAKRLVKYPGFRSVFKILFFLSRYYLKLPFGAAQKLY